VWGQGGGLGNGWEGAGGGWPSNSWPGPFEREAHWGMGAPTKEPYPARRKGAVMIPIDVESPNALLFGVLRCPNILGMKKRTVGAPGPPSSRHPGSFADPFEALGVAPAAASIIRYYLLRPEARPHAREIQRVLGLGGASLQRELERLVSLGALVRSREGRRVKYAVGPNPQLWAAFNLMMGTTSDPVGLIRDALRDLPGVTAAFLFGSIALGTQRSDSDVDLFVLETPESDRRTLLRQVVEAGFLLGREVNTLRYTEQSLAERLGDPSHPGAAFVRKVLAGPKRWVAGSPAPLIPLATASGLLLPEIAAASG